MKKLKPVIICCMLFTGMNQVQAQIGQLKSVTSTALSKKPAKNKTADTPKTSSPEANPETKTAQPDEKPVETKTEVKPADTLKTVTPEVKTETNTAKQTIPQENTETKPVKQDPPLPKYSAIKAVMTNAGVEKQAIEVVNQKATREKWNERYTKAKITSQWDVVKSHSGAILHRKIDVTLYGVWPNGECRATLFGFYQDYEGNGKYSSLRYNSIGGMTQVQCE